MECVPSRVGKGWEISITGSGGLSGERKERSSTGFQSEVMEIDFLHLLKSQDRIGKFTQTNVLKIEAESMKSRV